MNYNVAGETEVRTTNRTGYTIKLKAILFTCGT